MNLKRRKMRSLKTSLSIAIVGLVTLMSSACKDKNTGQKTIQTEMNKEAQNKQASKEMDIKAGFKDVKIAHAFQHYIHLKTALVNSDTREAKNGAKMLSEAFGADNEVKKTANAIVAAIDLEKQRELFSTLSTQIESILKDALASGEIYKQYCPMAFNNNGGYWLSDKKEIKNPYFGAQMLKCGAVKEIFRPF